ncbi:MAG: RNA-binding protein [Candidatus Lokiarchaeota archaeon]|nr:RNA-binding protein [Candidatus Lokiarchaeota archaeon]MBD3339241.1 RNA-binding protein [Candidatus Lokiarchaeota archaeon]
MEKKSVKNKDIVLTGQYLGVVEEFLPNDISTYIENGEIHATKSGMINIDNKRNIDILTHQEKDRKTVKIGDIVLGTIVFMRKYSVGINFYTINSKLHFNSSYFGNIHVSQIANRFIEKITDAFQLTDIVRAKVIEQNVNEYNLSTVGKEFGVVHSDCSICGTTLQKIGFNKLRCPLCGNLEKRKIASDYGDVEESLRF